MELPDAGIGKAPQTLDAHWSGLAVDVDTGKVAAVTGGDFDVARIDDRWLITPLAYACLIGVALPVLVGGKIAIPDAVLARGGVIGGSSAGASAIASFMVRGDTKNNTTGAMSSGNAHRPAGTLCCK